MFKKIDDKIENFTIKKKTKCTSIPIKIKMKILQQKKNTIIKN